jgi:hypothetical protein
MYDYFKDGYGYNVLPNQITAYLSGREEPDYFDWAESRDERTTEYKQGGLVDYTGLAMVHGSSTTPEAFLNAEQTALFGSLRDILSNISLSPGDSSSSINIENITISTNSLNNKQDFRKAGTELATAFNAAIGRRGLNINTKR